MSTIISMHSPSDGRFGSFDRHTMFRSTPRIRRPFEEERLKALASDEFSDDESDGVETDDEDDDLRREENEKEVVKRHEEDPDDVEEHQSEGPESEFELEDTILVPFVRPPPQPAPTETVTSPVAISPKSDDWTIVQKSPTFESVVHSSHVELSESWFVQPSA